MRIRQHSTGFNKKGLKCKGGGLEESRHDCQDWEVHCSKFSEIDKAPAAFHSWSVRSALKTPRAGTLPCLWPPAIQVLEIQRSGEKCGKSLREGSGSTSWAIQDSSLPLKSHFMILSSKAFCGLLWSSSTMPCHGNTESLTTFTGNGSLHSLSLGLGSMIVYST